MTIYDYARTSAEEKQLLINEEAILIDKFEDRGNKVYVYNLFEFFVEITMKDGIITDNIPYKRGYRFDKAKVHSLMKKNVLYNLAA